MTNDDSMAMTRREVALDTYSPVQLRARLQEMKDEAEIMQQFFNQVMVVNHDYGVIPGTSKPTLLKPGAEKLAEYYGYAPILKAIAETEDRNSGYYRARVTVALVSKGTGTVVAEGVGEANTMEGRYHWREAKRACPTCGSAAIIKGKSEYGGGWLCWAKQGGCGAKFGDNDPAIVEQPVGRVENDDPWALWNTVLKMGKKRALIDAVLSATRSSGIFTQDIEDLTGWIEGEVIDRGAAVDAAQADLSHGESQQGPEPSTAKAGRPPAAPPPPEERPARLAKIIAIVNALEPLDGKGKHEVLSMLGKNVSLQGNQLRGIAEVDDDKLDAALALAQGFQPALT